MEKREGDDDDATIEREEEELNEYRDNDEEEHIELNNENEMMPSAEFVVTNAYPSRRKVILHLLALFSGPVLSIPFYFDILKPGQISVSHCAAVTVWMSCWWFLEPLPVAITSLLPVILFPILGLASSKEIASSYFTDLTFMFIGSYLITIALEKWNVQRRFALFFLVKIFGVKNPRLVLFGLMFISWFCSMWISNTCTAAMLLPMANAILSNLKKDNPGDQKFSKAVVIGIAYASSVGGIATLIGTPPNLVFVNTMNDLFPKYGPFSFLKWMLFALPLATVLLLILYVLFVIVYLRGYSFSVTDEEQQDATDVTMSASDTFIHEYQNLGPMKREEALVIVLFCIVCLLWMTRVIPVGSGRQIGWAKLLFYSRDEKSAYVSDATAAIFIGITLFIIPSRSGGTLLDWKTVTDKMPWGIILLFGAGLALSKAFTISKFSDFISSAIIGVGHLPPFVSLLIICLVITFLTEITSNVATAALLLPIIAKFSIAQQVHQNPLFFLIPATISTSWAFMSPVGTPPNAIAAAFGYVKVSDMMKIGFVMNVVTVIFTVVWVYVLGGLVFGIRQNQLPEWV